MAALPRSAVPLLLMLLLSRAAHAGSAATEAPRAASPSPPAALLTGLVLDADTSQPLPGAVVTLTELERSEITGADGRYAHAGVPPGPHHITVRLIGYAPRTLHALVPADGKLEINISLEPRPLPIRQIDVPAPVATRGAEPGDSTARPDREISIAAVRNHQLLTEPDAFQALEGGEVVVRAETPTGIHVRGASTDHLAYLLDGVPVFSPHHAAGLSSAWNPDAIARLKLSTVGNPAASSHTLAGTLSGTTLAPGERLRGQGSVSTTQARLTLDGPLGAAGASYLLSGRTGFAGLLSRKSESSHLRGETGDWLAKVELPSLPAISGRLRVLGYDSSNEIDAAAAVSSTAPPPPAPNNTFNWRSRSWGGEWRRAFSGATLRVSGWTALGNSNVHWNAAGGPVRLTAERRDVGILADVERRTPRATYRAGLNVERAKTEYRFLSDSLAPGDGAFAGRTPVASAFAHGARRIGARTEVGVGGTVAATERDVYASPAASLRWEASTRLSFSASYARAHQFAQSLRNPESVVGTIFPVDLYVGAERDPAPGDLAVPVARSHQGVLAAEIVPAPGVRLTIQGYARDANRLLLVAPRSGEPFLVTPFVVGATVSRGASIEASRSGARYGVLANYGYQDVRVEYGDSSYVPEHGAKHSLVGGVIYFPWPTLSIRLGAEAAWGRRTTVASGEFEWEACNLLDRGCEFGGSPRYWGEPLGGARLPAYFRLDLGVRQHWHLGVGGRDVSMAIFAAATNILERKNVLTYARNPADGQVTPIEMRPRSPLVIGLDWRF
jgi:hypothetical protein